MSSEKSSKEPESKTKNHLPEYLTGIIFVILIGAIIYLVIQSKARMENINALEGEVSHLDKSNDLLTETLATERELASSTIRELSNRLSLTAEELEDIEKDYRKERDKNDEFEDQIEDLSGTLEILDKLSKTDAELLQKYSRTYFLNENFVPLKLTKIKDKYVMEGKDSQYFHGDAIDFLEDMLDAAKRAGHDIKVISAYRSFDEQVAVKGQYTQIYGSGANAFSADQGYSEHQLGTTLDIVDVDTRISTTDFANTEAYEWLLKNAYRYGFVLSYPEGNDFYIFEPWHWRFVGEDLARDLNRKDAEFYEWDQRKIDEYLVKIFD